MLGLLESFQCLFNPHSLRHTGSARCNPPSGLWQCNTRFWAEPTVQCHMSLRSCLEQMPGRLFLPFCWRAMRPRCGITNSEARQKERRGRAGKCGRKFQCTKDLEGSFSSNLYLSPSLMRTEVWVLLLLIKTKLSYLMENLPEISRPPLVLVTGRYCTCFQMIESRGVSLATPAVGGHPLDSRRQAVLQPRFPTISRPKSLIMVHNFKSERPQSRRDPQTFFLTGGTALSQWR